MRRAATETGPADVKRGICFGAEKICPDASMGDGHCISLHRARGRDMRVLSGISMPLPSMRFLDFIHRRMVGWCQAGIIPF
jgi:hypothetical protein